jgi:hypothetical protein
MSRIIKKTKTKNVSILIALEDEKSSRFYIRELIKDKNLAANVTFAEHIGSDPKSVLKAITRFKNDNPTIKYEKAWLVIDRDSFDIANFKGTLETARHNNICVAYSNECYELWLLLHFKDVSKFKTRQELRSELNTEFEKNFKNIGYEKSERNVYGMLIDRQEDAIKRAEKLIERTIRDNGCLDPFINNPSTQIHVLIKCLNELNSCQKNSYMCQDK